MHCGDPLLFRRRLASNLAFCHSEFSAPTRHARLGDLGRCYARIAHATCLVCGSSWEALKETMMGSSVGVRPIPLTDSRLKSGGCWFASPVGETLLSGMSRPKPTICPVTTLTDFRRKPRENVSRSITHQASVRSRAPVVHPGGLLTL